jgi:hypothetical protein
MLNKIVNNQEQYGQQNIVQACFQQHFYRLGVFPVYSRSAYISSGCPMKN